MNKKYLLLGDETISNALAKVLSLMTDHHYEMLHTTMFTDTGEVINELGKLRDDNEIKGIIINGTDGVELFKHLRLTEFLGHISLLPIMVLNGRTLADSLNERQDNIMLLSPKCHVISISSCLPELLKVMDNSTAFGSHKEMREGIKPFVIWSEEDDVISRHDNFNRYGPFKLMKENFETLADPLLQEYDALSNRLWFKKYKFLETKNTLPGEIQVDEELFRKTVASKKILYIDDEHRLGWSFALYSLISGNSDQSHYQVFQDSASVISTSDSRFTSIDNVRDALKVIETYQETLTRALTEYSDAEHLRNRLAEQAFEAKKSTQEMEDRFRKSETNFYRSEASLRETEARLKDVNAKLKKALDDFLEAYTKRIGDIEIPDILPQIKEVSDIHAHFAQEGAAFNKYREECKRNKDIFEKHKNELERQKPLLEEADTNNRAAIKRYDVAVRALSQGRMFPYDLVILDLRLERLLDKGRIPSEISGVQVLKRIKEIDPSIPVLMFTASEKVMNYQQATDLGASGYWIKAVNSLTSLKSEIINSLAKTQEARNLWHGIRRIEAKKQLTYIRENQNSQELEKGTLSDSKKAEIIQLLKESFLLFMKELSPYEQTIYKYNHYGKIVLNMGMIQEERFSRLQDKRWDFWVNRKAREIDQEEITIRQLRNKGAHRAGAGITYQEALGVFQKTIERCLKA